MTLHRIRKGLDLPISGDPAQVVAEARAVARVALLAADYVGLKPAIRVQPGDRVLRGQPVIDDKRQPGVRLTAPASGTIAAVHRGEKRALHSMVIDVDPADGPGMQTRFETFTGRDPASLTKEDVRALLLESGLWAAFRTRPFSRIPPPDGTPQALFVTAIDTRPHAPSPEVALAGREADFRAGLACIQTLCDGPTHLCTAPGSPLGASATGRVQLQEFAGPHPAGTAGVHIHLLHPVDLHRTVWHLGYQDVAAIGRLFRTGELDVERVISLAGPSVARPRLVRARLGASTEELTSGELREGEHRIVSGSVLDGRTAQGDALGYLGRYHLQVSALREGRERELLGWLAPGADKFSVTGSVLGAFLRRRKFGFTTTTNGSPRAMVPIGTYERVMPMDLLPTFLFRALITGDVQRAEALGALELDEEDVALSTYVCPGKFEYGPLLRRALDQIAKDAS